MALQINGEPFLDFPRPFHFGVQYLGEMGMKKKQGDISEKDKDIGEPWNEIFQKDNKGIVLFSLGTIANTTLMPDYMSVCSFIWY